jgi:hypothetical protein
MNENLVNKQGMSAGQVYGGNQEPAKDAMPAEKPLTIEDVRASVIAEVQPFIDKLIETIKSELQGKRLEKSFDMDKKKDVVKEVTFGEPIMNDKGINETCRILRMFLSKPFLLSNFPKEDRPRIDMMMIILWKKLAGKYAVQAQEYALDRSRRSDIAFSIVSMVYMNIMRSYEDGERPRMYGSHKTVQSIQQNSNGSMQQPKKVFGIFG